MFTGLQHGLTPDWPMILGSHSSNPGSPQLLVYVTFPCAKGLPMSHESWETELIEGVSVCNVSNTEDNKWTVIYSVFAHLYLCN